MFDDVVFVGCVYGLKDQQQGVVVVGVKQVLQFVELLDVSVQLVFVVVFVCVQWFYGGWLVFEFDFVVGSDVIGVDVDVYVMDFLSWVSCQFNVVMCFWLVLDFVFLLFQFVDDVVVCYFFLLLGLVGFFVYVVFVVDEVDVKFKYQFCEYYIKYEYCILVCDGCIFFIVVYLFKDQSWCYFFLMVCMFYSCGFYGVDCDGLGYFVFNEDFLKVGYIFVCQDVCGCFMFQGEFVEMMLYCDVKKMFVDIDESSDIYDSVQWLIDYVLNNNGCVGFWGILYLGFYMVVFIIDLYFVIKVVLFQVFIVDFYMGDDSYYGGVFMLVVNFGFYMGFKCQQILVLLFR